MQRVHNITFAYASAHHKSLVLCVTKIEGKIQISLFKATNDDKRKKKKVMIQA